MRLSYLLVAEEGVGADLELGGGSPEGGAFSSIAMAFYHCSLHGVSDSGV